MKKNKYIREIASQLPPVYEQTISGFTLEDGKPQPNFVVHPINHERRLRKAYQQLGMQGVLSYLEGIQKLQKERREDIRSSD